MRLGKSLLTVCVATACLAGCGDSKSEPEQGAASEQPATNVVQPGAPGEPSRKLPPGTKTEQLPHTEADVAFMQGMIHHHQQAIVMTDWVPDRTESTSIRLLAKRMSISQTDEMKQMREWLTKRDFDPGDHSHAHKPMPGMVNSRQLAKLKAAKGADFDRLFLRYMTQHHNGALIMVDQLKADGGGGETDIGVFTNHVYADQSIEIGRMQELLNKL
jgi:uncharacterized protein (DUF305 family)